MVLLNFAVFYNIEKYIDWLCLQNLPSVIVNFPRFLLIFESFWYFVMSSGDHNVTSITDSQLFVIFNSFRML